MKKMWTKKDDAYLKRHWQEMSDQEIGEKLDRSKAAIRKHRRRLGLLRNTLVGVKWTEEETVILREKYPNMSSKEVAALLGWSKSDRQVSTKGTLLGLRKVYKHNMEWMAEHDEEIRAMKEKDMTVAAIACVLGVSASLVYKYWQKQRGNSRKKTVEQYTLGGVKLAEYGSPIEAGRKMGADSGSNISQCCNGKIQTAYGFIWRYKS